MNQLRTDWLVAQKLGKPYHKFGMEDYEAFNEQGLTLELEDVKVKISKEEFEEALDEASGSAFRK